MHGCCSCNHLEVGYKNRGAAMMQRLCFINDSVLVGLDFFVPGVGVLEGVVDVVDVFYAGGVEPVFEGLCSLLGVDGDAVLPGGAAAEDAVEAGSGFGGELEGLDEDGVGDAGGEIDEGLA